MDALDKFEWQPHDGGYEIVVKTPSVLRAAGVRAVDPKTDEKIIGYARPGQAQAAEPMIIPTYRLRGDDPLLMRKAILRLMRGPTPAKYRPLDREHSGLFQILANTPASNKGILKFAHEYGLLGLNLTAVSFDLRRDPLDQFEEEERVSVWKREIRHLRSVVKRWQVLRQHPDDKSARDLSDTINLELHDRAGQRVTWDPEGERFDIGPIPISLIGAIWLQLGFAMARPTSYQECRRCHKPFEIAGGRDTGKRADAIFCGRACISADYRERVAKAGRLAEEGQKLRAIADAVERPVATVRKWIQDRKART